MVRLPEVDRPPKGKAWKKALLLETKRGGPCGLWKALREGQEHPGKTLGELAGKAEGKITSLFESSLRQRVQIRCQVKAHQKTSLEWELSTSRREAKNYLYLLEKF